MATVTPTRASVVGSSSSLRVGSIVGNDTKLPSETIVWTALTTTNQDGLPLLVGPNVIDMSFHVTGTDGTGGALTIQTSNDATNWVTAQDREGADMSSFAAGSFGSPLNLGMLYFRPLNTAGDGSTSHTVTCVVNYR